MNNKEIHVLAINETGLDNSIPIPLITVHGYTWIYKHRNRSGGGIGFYIKDSINYRIRSDLNDPDIEILPTSSFLLKFHLKLLNSNLSQDYINMSN